MVPPTEVTSGSDDGQEFTGTLYRVLASNVGVGRAVVTGGGEHRDAVSLRVLERVPQVEQAGEVAAGEAGEGVLGRAEALRDHVADAVVDRATSRRSSSPGKPDVPSVSATGVSTSTIFAPGAIACAYSTSSVVSSAQPTMVESVGSNGGTLPDCDDLQRGVRQAPLRVEGVAGRSLMVGEPNESTITIVRPAPVMDRPGAAVVERVQVVGDPVLQRRVARDAQLGPALRGGDRRREPLGEDRMADREDGLCRGHGRGRRGYGRDHQRQPGEPADRDHGDDPGG